MTNNERAGMPWSTAKMIFAVIALVIIMGTLITPVRELAAKSLEKVGIGQIIPKEQKESICDGLIKEQCETKNYCISQTLKGKYSCQNCPKTCKEIEEKSTCTNIKCNNLECEWEDNIWPLSDVCEPQSN